ncbi:MAG: DUF370 domain-containing protein [Clostridia bacterium]|nr:DUF370 domain-containing protein [Clostridia bacterium]
MYLHIGNNKTIRLRDIVGIFDADTATQSAVTKKYLSDASRRGEVNTASEELPKSFILYRSKGKFEIYFSQISVSTLQKRMSGM